LRTWKTISLAIVSVIVFWFVKFILKFPGGDLGIVSIILTVASVLFGFLSGFSISELWDRYTNLRNLQSMRLGDALNMIQKARFFFKGNKKFENAFKKSIEKAAIADEIAEWDETHLELPYFRSIGETLKLIEEKQVKGNKGAVIFDNLLYRYSEFIKNTVQQDVLGKERLFNSEWFMLIALSIIITFSTLSLEVTKTFYQIIIFTFPVIITMALLIIYDLDKLLWGKNIISLEPNAQLFDEIGVKRFYLKKKESFIKGYVKNYRTEDNLKGEFKKVYLDVTAKQKKTNK